MGTLRTFFFDTYAFHEILSANYNYACYKKGISIITTKLNLMELHYMLMIKYGKKLADVCFDKFLKYAVYIPDDVIKKASEFRAANRHKKFSYIDCVGYILAKARNARFLTGDSAFEGMENVEFVR